VTRQSRAELKRSSRRPPVAHGIASHKLQLAMTSEVIARNIEGDESDAAIPGGAEKIVAAACAILLFTPLYGYHHFICGKLQVDAGFDIKNTSGKERMRNRLINIFYRTATGNRRIRALLTPVGPVFFFGLLTLIVAASLQTDRMLGQGPFLTPPFSIVLAVPLLAIGLFLTLWSVSNFLKVKGTPVPFNPPPRLVDTGPYAHVRNPMLTGVFLVLFGLGVFLGSISLTLIFTPLFILLNVWELKAVEEPELEKRLGAEYAEYRRRVPMFFPRFRR